MDTGERIALFLPLLVGGGAERVMVNLAQGFVDQGFEIDLVLGKAEGPYLAQVPEKVRIVDLQAGRVLTCLPGLVRYLRETRPLAMISALGHANLVALWAKRLSRAPSRIVLSLHCTVSETKKDRPLLSKQQVFPFLIRNFYPWADAIVAVSHGVAEDFSKEFRIPIDRIKVIYNGVITEDLCRKALEPLEHPWFAPSAPPVVLTVGRLSEQKNHSLLIRAFAKVQQQMPARLMILGEGELRSSLETQVKDLNLEDDISLPGFVLNPYQYMSRASLFVLSSKWEGLPTVLIESLAVGTNVISTDCKSGPNEILKGGKFGKLVPVDDEDQLAAAVLEFLKNHENSRFSEPLDEYKPKWAVDSYWKVINGNIN